VERGVLGKSIEMLERDFTDHVTYFLMMSISYSALKWSTKFFHATLAVESETVSCGVSERMARRQIDGCGWVRQWMLDQNISAGHVLKNMRLDKCCGKTDDECSQHA